MQLSRFVSNRGGGALVLVALMVFSLFASAPVAGMSDHTGPLTADQYFEGSADVNVWERGYLPLRTDMSNAMTKVDEADWQVRTTDDSEISVGKEQMGVYSKDATINLDFQDARAQNSDFNGQQVQLIAAHIKGDPSTDIPDSFSEMVDLVSMQNSNDVATFEEVGQKSIDSEGNVEFNHTAGQSGMYVYFLALTESGQDGYTVNSAGELSLDGKATVIGIETAAVQKGASSVDHQNSVTRGNNVNFDVDASDHLSGNDVTHTVLLYDEDTYVNQRFMLDLKEEPSADFSFSEDATLEHSVGDVNGVMEVSGNPDFFGATMSDEKLTGMSSFATTLDFFADKFHTVSPETTATDDTRLDASMKVIEGDATEQVTVETMGNWRPGTYRWVAVSSTENSGEFVTDMGTITIKKASSGGGGGDTPPSDPPDDAPGDPPVEIDREVTEEGIVKLTITNFQSGKTVTIDLADTPATKQGGVKLNAVQATMANGEAFTMSVNALDDVPEDTPPVTRRGAVRPLTYINVEHSNTNDAFSGGTFEFTVDEEQLNGEDPENVGLYRFNDDEWNPLDTRLVSQSDGEYTFEADTPGFSVFALGVKQAQISVTDASLAQQSIAPGEQSTVSATVTNDGEAAGEYLVQLFVDGNVEAEQSVQVGAGESQTVTFDRTWDDAGSYDVAVNNQSAGTLDVAQQTGTATGTADPGTGTPDGESPGATDGPEDTEEPSNPLDTILSIPVLIGVVVIILIAAIYGLNTSRKE